MKRKSNIPGIIRLKNTAYNYINNLSSDEIINTSMQIIYRKGYSIMINLYHKNYVQFVFVERGRR